MPRYPWGPQYWPRVEPVEDVGMVRRQAEYERWLGEEAAEVFDLSREQAIASLRERGWLCPVAVDVVLREARAAAKAVGRVLWSAADDRDGVEWLLVVERSDGRLVVFRIDLLECVGLKVADMRAKFQRDLHVLCMRVEENRRPELAEVLWTVA